MLLSDKITINVSIPLEGFGVGSIVFRNTQRGQKIYRVEKEESLCTGCGDKCNWNAYEASRIRKLPKLEGPTPILEVEPFLEGERKITYILTSRNYKI